jgi:hypothetical protein
MRNLIIIMAAVLATASTHAGSAITFTLSTWTNTSASAYASTFTGEIEDITVYPSTGATGAVAVAAIDPYSGGALVLATNAAVTAANVFVPRVVNSEAIGGAAARVVTNDVTAARYLAQGEKILVTVSDSTTNSTYRVRIKLK